ncbi:LptA/OstA family protein [Siccirubricoccus phaeus]|uniref:LptA/OstA family protein n=1 Tax=Siccirubricoccus phaeus TaxID=2595053 RepID=UPI0011F2855A|nr:LptA/OstA family protein [Siccirubricoccus phaeus]
MRRPLLLAALLLAAPLAGPWAAGPALAQGIDLSQGGPIDVTASDGIEWRQAEQVVIARGNARAARADVVVTSDRLLARYRPRGGGAQSGAPRPGAPGSATQAAARPPGAEGTGGASEIWRLEAEGRVRIATQTDTARGDRAVYDIDQAVLVLTGRDLGLDTPQQRITARDSLEYWSQRKMAVARGNAVVVDTVEDRRITADTLVAYFLDAPGSSPAPRPVVAPGEREVPGSGRLDRVEAFGNVEIRTPTEVVRGTRGVYSAATGMARLLGEVRITRGENQLNGREAIVNMRTGVARLVSAPGARVQGLVVPNSEQGGAAPGAQPQPAESPAGERRP